MTPSSFQERPTCPSCGGRERTIHIAFPEIPVVRCTRCEFLYSGRVLNAEEIDRYYQQDFGSTRHREGQLVNARVNARLVRRLLGSEPTGTLLDVGTGYGFLLHELRRLTGLQLFGVELSQQEASYAREHLGLEVVNASLARSGLRAGSFDLVTSFEVIEHHPTPQPFLEEMAAMVKHGGHLLVMTDNFESRLARQLGPGFPKWIPHSHISHFSAATLERALGRLEGFEIVARCSYSPWEIHARVLRRRLSRRTVTPEAAFRLEEELATEMSGTYRWFHLRKLINPAWARLTVSERMDGDLIYFLLRRTRSNTGSAPAS